MNSILLQSKSNLLSARECFFNGVLTALKVNLLAFEELTGWHVEYIAPLRHTIDVEFGTLHIEIAPNFVGEGDLSRYFYCITIMGDILRIGIFMPISPLLSAPAQEDGQRHLSDIWNGQAYKMFAREKGVLYEWTFTEFDSNNWVCIEKYILGMRQLHRRFLSLMSRIVYAEFMPDANSRH